MDSKTVIPKVHTEQTTSTDQTSRLSESVYHKHTGATHSGRNVCPQGSESSLSLPLSQQEKTISKQNKGYISERKIRHTFPRLDDKDFAINLSRINEEIKQNSDIPKALSEDFSRNFLDGITGKKSYLEVIENMLRLTESQVLSEQIDQAIERQRAPFKMNYKYKRELKEFKKQSKLYLSNLSLRDLNEFKNHPECFLSSSTSTPKYNIFDRLNSGDNVKLALDEIKKNSDSHTCMKLRKITIYLSNKLTNSEADGLSDQDKKNIRRWFSIAVNFYRDIEIQTKDNQ